MMFIFFRAATIIVFLVWFSAFFTLIFPSGVMRYAVMDLWGYSFNFLPEVSSRLRLVYRITFFGFSVGVIFFGSLSDRVGRYRVMLFGLFGAPIFSAVCGYFADALLFLILHFFLGVFIGGVLVSSSVFIFESTPAPQRWRVFSCAIFGGVIGIVLPFLLSSIGWRALYQLQLSPIFLVFLFWHWFDEPLIWKFAIRDKQVDDNTMKSSPAYQGFQITSKSENLLTHRSGGGNGNGNGNGSNIGGGGGKRNINGGGLRQFYVTIINNIGSAYFKSFGDVLLNRQYFLFPAIILTIFGVCGLAISVMSFGDGVRQRIYQSYDLDKRTAMRVSNGDADVGDIDAALVMYIMEKPLVLDLINMDDDKLNLLPQTLRCYGYSRDDVPGCVADGLFELVKSLRGERITRELVIDRTISRWNSKHRGGKTEIDMPENIKNRIKLKAGLFLLTGDRTLQEILAKKQEANNNDKNITKINERKKTTVDKWQQRRNDFLLMWEELLYVTEGRYIFAESCVARILLCFLLGCLSCNLLGMIFGGLGRSFKRRRVFSVIFVVSALLSMMAAMLWQAEVVFIVPLIFAFIYGLIFALLVTCYLVTIPAMFAVTRRGAAVGICFGLPLLVVLNVICIVPAPYIYYLIPVCFVSAVFANEIPYKKS
ncbi:MAG: MFS transporter [Planctomycetaceae bacterium]|jgi:MFS family permease|nr:MFS transporter [Planctomycetaceae bacterium]